MYIYTIKNLRIVVVVVIMSMQICMSLYGAAEEAERKYAASITAKKVPKSSVVCCDDCGKNLNKCMSCCVPVENSCGTQYTCWCCQCYLNCRMRNHRVATLLAKRGSQAILEGMQGRSSTEVAQVHALVEAARTVTGITKTQADAHNDIERERINTALSPRPGTAPTSEQLTAAHALRIQQYQIARAVSRPGSAHPQVGSPRSAFKPYSGGAVVPTEKAHVLKAPHVVVVPSPTAKKSSTLSPKSSDGSSTPSGNAPSQLQLPPTQATSVQQHAPITPAMQRS